MQRAHHTQNTQQKSKNAASFSFQGHNKRGDDFITMASKEFIQGHLCKFEQQQCEQELP